MSVEEERKAQENLKNMINSGYYKVLCELQKAMYDEYIHVGFTPEQAMQLIMNSSTKDS